MKLTLTQKTIGILFAIGLQLSCFFIVLNTPSLPVSFAALCSMVFGMAVFVSIIFKDEIK
jgi:hypothetical protein